MNRSTLVGWLTLTLGLLNTAAFAEPWLGTRFAQNCAACHAPGRLNVAPSERRCTLSCQGCHVNPNGGGIRNFYGAWNQQRWLRAYNSDLLNTSKPTPAPFAEQIYAKKKAPGDKSKAELGPTLAAQSAPVDEKQYSRADGQEHIIAGEDEFLTHVPSDDPYRQEWDTIVTGGGDFRYITTVPLGENGPQDRRFNNQFRSWWMAVDVGARVRPLHDHMQLVFETRYLNPPTNRTWDQTFTNEVRIRSAYALFDDLPYNSYLMYGLYRPMFGLYNPDHDSLSNVISGLNQRNVYKSVGIGMAPNVPFANFNILTPLTSTNYDQSSGFNLNFGGRWVTYGASLVLSYWNTASPDTAGNHLRNQMFTLTGGLAYQKFLWNWEVLYVTRESAPGISDAAMVFTNQFKYRFWRETYAELNLGLSNSAMNLKQGASDEIIFGVRSFLLAGIDLELLFNFRDNHTTTIAQSAEQLQLMMHLFF